MVKKYLEFFEINTAKENRKTKVFRIFNKVTKDDIGDVQWNGAWRQYCFYPDPYTHWAGGCLREITEFIDELMKERKR